MDDWFGFQGGLVAVGLLATVPGCKDPDTDTTTGNTTSTEPASTGDTPTGSDSATGDTPTSSDSATGSATGTTGDADVPPACVAYGAKVAECNMDPIDPMDVEQQCALTLMELEAYGADCVKAYEAYLACVSALSCAEAGSDPPPCEAEMQAIETECVPEVPPVCVSYGARYAECLMEPDAVTHFEQACGYALMQYYKYYGADCGQAQEAWFACLSALNCEEFLGNKMDDLPVCETEDMARQTACN